MPSGKRRSWKRSEISSGCQVMTYRPHMARLRSLLLHHPLGKSIGGLRWVTGRRKAANSDHEVVLPDVDDVDVAAVDRALERDRPLAELRRVLDLSQALSNTAALGKVRQCVLGAAFGIEPVHADVDRGRIGLGAAGELVFAEDILFPAEFLDLGRCIRRVGE